MINLESFAKPRVIVLISVVSSAIIYGCLVILLDLKEPLIGFMIATGAPFAVSLPIALIISKYIKTIQKQNEELSELDSTNKRLFYLISHDLRTPIASQKAMIELLINGDLDSAEGKEMLQEIAQKTNRLITFLNDILNWAKKQQSQEKLEKRYFEAKDVIKPLLDLYQGAAQNKGLKIEVRTLDYRLYADEDSYSFVVRNLLHSAIKFTPEGGTIAIDCKKVDEQVHTQIIDSGVGMKEEQIAQLKAGQHWHSTPGTNNEEGTGFGIGACLKYLEENDGELHIESTEGEGSAFTIVLPTQASA